MLSEEPKAHIIPGNETEIAPLPRSVDSELAAGAVAGLLDSQASPEEVEEVVSFVAAVPLGVRRIAPRWVAPVFAGVAICIVPWIVYLAFELPERNTAQHYNLAWSGFDVLLLCFLARTALLAWRGKRQVQLPRWLFTSPAMSTGWWSAPNTG
jgi:hypothetical protein